MPNFVELWVYLSSAPLFGLTATLAVYVLAQALALRSGYAPWANPVLLSVTVLAALMLATGTAYPTYFSGAQFIHFLLGPAVVALGWPLWQRRAALAAREFMAEQWGWVAYPKTSGGRGVHVYIRIQPRWTFTDIRHAAIAIGRALERQFPGEVTTKWWKSRPRKKP